VIDEDFEKMNIRGIMVFLHLSGNIRMRREGKRREGHFCPFPVHFVNLMTWQ